MTDRDATQAFYGRWARLYDLIATAPGVRSWRETAADALALSPGDTVVEMGCGTGANLLALRERVGPDGRVVGIDLTREVLGVARDRVTRAGWDNVHLVRADARRPPVAGPVDAVLGTFVVGMFDDPEAVVSDWLDLLTADGAVALLNATRSDHPLAVPVNLAFRGFVRLSTPGTGRRGDGGAGRSPTAVLEERIEAGARAVERGTTAHERRTLAGGFVRLHRGRRPR